MKLLKLLFERGATTATVRDGKRSSRADGYGTKGADKMKYEIYNTHTNEVVMRVEADGMVETEPTLNGSPTPCLEFVNNDEAVGLLVFQKSADYAVRQQA